MRPVTLDEMVGQKELLGPEGPLRLLLEGDSLPSLVLWGPPGCGKTTRARLVAGHTQARFLEYSAVAVGSKELKAVMSESEKLKRATGTRSIQSRHASRCLGCPSERMNFGAVAARRTRRIIARRG